MDSSNSERLHSQAIGVREFLHLTVQRFARSQMANRAVIGEGHFLAQAVSRREHTASRFDF